MTNVSSFALRTPFPSMWTEECRRCRGELTTVWSVRLLIDQHVEYSTESKCSSYSHPPRSSMANGTQPPSTLNAIALNSQQAFTLNPIRPYFLLSVSLIRPFLLNFLLMEEILARMFIHGKKRAKAVSNGGVESAAQ